MILEQIRTFRNTRIAKLGDNYGAGVTLKYLFGVGSGKSIVEINWINECLKQGRIDLNMVDEVPYEDLDCDKDSVPFIAGQTCYLKISNFVVKELSNVRL